MLNSPAVILLCTHWWLGLKRRVWPTIATRPLAFCAAATASAPCRLSANGISTCTCLPAFRQAMLCSACICVGVHRMTASTSFSARLSAELGADMADAVLGGHLLGLVEFAADQRDDLDAVDQLDGVEVLDAEGAGAGESDFDGHVFSRIRWPTAVFDAGT